MMYKISSEKKNESLTTRDPMKDAAWGNTYFATDDCTVTAIPDVQRQEPSSTQVEIAEKRAFLASTDYKVIRQIEQSTLSSQEYAELLSLRQAARDRINELEGV